MKILVTGGAGFIGRWLVKKLLDGGHHLWVLDNLSGGSLGNILEFRHERGFMDFLKGDVCDRKLLSSLFKNGFDICYHLAASINVQDSIDRPRSTFENDVIGSFNVLEECRLSNTKIVFMSTCMVYEHASENERIDESHPLKPASPYAGSKMSAENMVLSYWHAYKHPAVILRPFNTYGPYQKTSGEGGVISIFIRKALSGKPLCIYGDGEQTRDFLYVEDCADFVAKAGFCDEANGKVINAGTGNDISINNLATMICKETGNIIHVPHIHPQSEIKKLLCNFDLAKKLLGWKPTTSLEEGVENTKKWIIESERT